MNFTFTEDQNTFADATRAVLTAEVTADRIRDRWLTASGIDGPLLQQIQELGVPGMLVPEALGGLGLGQTDFVMMAQTCGYVACPEPIAEQAMVTAPLLVDVLDKGLGNGSVQTALDALQGGGQWSQPDTRSIHLLILLSRLSGFCWGMAKVYICCLQKRSRLRPVKVWILPGVLPR
ncbi:acyl-CoA dehydrogenase family protein [Luminiphilus sp.]|nr:acyl-CoA dehydrogenase family protein [Luminiphilus sp.]